MNKKILILLIIITTIFSISAGAYYKDENPTLEILKVRDAERYIREARQSFNKANNKFEFLDQAELKINFSRLQELYQQLIRSYQNGDQTSLNKLTIEIKKLAQKIDLMCLESKQIQLRGLWLDHGTFARTKGRAGLAKLLDQAVKANLNTIFAEIYYKGKTVIPSNQLFQQDSIFADWTEDPLQVLLEEAARRNLEVHGWVWVFNENTVGKPGVILNQHPDWANKSKQGKIITYHNSSWLSPARPEVRKYLQQRYLYLVKNYQLAGINFDYIRYPEEYQASFGYDQVSRELFQAKYGLDPLTIKASSPEADLWNKFRENLVTQMVKESSQLLKKADPELLLSADVIPGRQEARYRVLQDWSYWLEKDYLDFVLPMTYTENLFSELENWLLSDRKAVKKPLYPGISVFKLSQSELIQQINEINQLNPNGFSLFAAAHLTADDYFNLGQGILRKKAIIPFRQPAKSLKVLQELILKRINLLKSQQEINNQTAIALRGYLNQILKTKEQSLTLAGFIDQQDLKLSQQANLVLAKDFAYLADIIKLY